jgi:hypothetical protein
METARDPHDVGLLSTLFQFSCNHKFLLDWIVLHAQQVWLAANLAILNVGLVATGGGVHRCLVPFATAGALESGIHVSIFDRPMPIAN